MVGERPQTRTPAVLAWTTAILGRLCPPAFLRSLHATLSPLFATSWRAGPTLAATAARWVSPASSASTGGYRLVAVVFVAGCALRVILSFLNQEANDDHMSIIRAIGLRRPGAGPAGRLAGISAQALSLDSGAVAEAAGPVGRRQRRRPNPHRQPGQLRGGHRAASRRAELAGSARASRPPPC